MRDKAKRLLQFQAPLEITDKVERVANQHHSSIAGALLFIVEDWFRKQDPVAYVERFNAEPTGGGTLKLLPGQTGPVDLTSRAGQEGDKDQTNPAHLHTKRAGRQKK